MKASMCVRESFSMCETLEREPLCVNVHTVCNEESVGPQFIVNLLPGRFDKQVQV